MSLEAFRAAVPVRTYEQFEPWLDMCREGSLDVLWPGRPTHFVTTSGTTSAAKVLPITLEFLSDFHYSSHLAFNRFFVARPQVARGSVLAIGGPSVDGYEGGIPRGSITGVLFASLPPLLGNRLAVPPIVHDISSPEDRWYSIARFALERDVTSIVSISAVSLLVLANAIRLHADELIDDIEKGELSRPTGLGAIEDATLRSALRPNRKRAEYLRRRLPLTPQVVWNLSGLCTYTTSFAGSLRSKVSDLFGDILVLDTGLVASEGRISVGLHAGTSTSMVMPLRTFVEFLEVDLRLQNGVGSTPFLPHELIPGRLYSPVISGRNGLLRYHLKDVVRCVSIRHRIPEIQYAGRLDGAVSCVGEKVTDAHVQAALELVGVKPSDHFLWKVSTEWAGGFPKYVLWLEEPAVVGPEELDRALRKVNVSYARKREQGLLRSASVRRVPSMMSDLNLEGKLSRLAQSKLSRLEGNVLR